MIKAKFFIRDDKPCGFTVSGHSYSAESGHDIICAAVSSACYMAANTVTEVLGVNIDSEVSDGYMKITLCGKSSAASDVLAGLELHLNELAAEYPDFIRITTEV